MPALSKNNNHNKILSFLKIAYAVSKKSLPNYFHKFSPQKFTRPQVMACLLLREYFKLDLRRLEELVNSNPEFLKILKLKHSPDYTTFYRQLSKTSDQELQKILSQTLKRLPKEFASAIDSTGFSSNNKSFYYASKTNKLCKGFLKFSCVAGITSMFIFSCKVHAWPVPNDRADFLPLTYQALKRASFATILADKGYDSENLHYQCRKYYGIKTIIPTIVPAHRVKTGKHRLEMANKFPKDIYKKRWKIESVFSVIKRKFGGYLKSTSLNCQLKEVMMKAITYNIERLQITDLYFFAIYKFLNPL